MLEYKNELKLLVHMRNGSTSLSDLEQSSEEVTPLDRAIIQIAPSVLKGQVLITFFHAYRCTETWEDIQMQFWKRHRKELDRETVQKYGRQALTRIVDKASELKEALS